jgi:hypothetical protein
LWHVGVTPCHFSLDINCTPHRIHYAAELGQQAIPRIFDNAPTVLSDLGGYDGAQVVREPRVRPLLVQTGQAAVASHIGSYDGCKPTLYAVGGGQDGAPVG